MSENCYLPVKPDTIPAEMQAQPHWVCWHSVARPSKNKPDKVPIDPKTGSAASVTDPTTWGTFDQALAMYEGQAEARIDGIGYVFSDHDPFTGIDFDATGPDLPAYAISLNSYTERSPSGNGFHVIVRGKPARAIKTARIEVYGAKRFFTMTGHHVEGTPSTINAGQAQIDELLRPHRKAETTTHADKGKHSGGAELSDEDLIRRARSASNGDKFSQLWSGDRDGYPSDSEADLALCNALAFWTGGDAERIDRLFRKSGRYRFKWERQDYREQTIQKAIASCSHFYGHDGTCPPAPDCTRPEREHWQTTFTAAELLAEKDEPTTPRIDGHIAQEGLHALGAAPKIGKSRMMLQQSIAIATGGTIFGVAASPAPVLYLALEDSKRRLRKRLGEMLGPDPILPANLHIHIQWPRGEEGIRQLEKWLQHYGPAGYVGIDTWPKFRPGRSNKGNAYDEDYAHANMVKELADSYHVPIELSAHTRKPKGITDEDWINEITGTLGFVAACDVVRLIKRPRKSPDGVLYVTGRDLDEKELAVRVDHHTGCWSVLGDADKVRLAKTKKRIRDFLSRYGQEIHYSDLAEELEITKANAKRTCLRMHQEELIQKGSKPGTYKR